MSKKKDSQNKVFLEFIGNNAVEVTGSCIYFKFFDKDLNRDVHGLLECGISQSGTILENYNINKELIDKIDAKSLDFVIVNHLHGDHASNIVSLVAKTGDEFRGKILMTKESAAMALPMWNDSAYINEKDCDWLKKCRNVKAKPLYKMSDVGKAMDLIERIPTEEMITLTPNIKMRFLKSRHILGSVTTELYFSDTKSHVHKLYYTSDIGNEIKDGKYFVYDTQLPTKTATVSIYESTYGSKSKEIIEDKTRNQELKILEEKLEEILILKGGSCLFPCFSLQRSPEVLLNIKRIICNNDKLKNTQIILDGKLTNELIDVYKNVCEGQNKLDIEEILNYENLIRIRSYKETASLSSDPLPKIIISSAGFLQTGHSTTWAKTLLPNKKNCLIFTGYAPPASPSGKIKNKSETGQRTIKMDGSIILMNADVLCLNSFSSHIQRKSLIKFILSTATSQEIVLVHGEQSGKYELKEDLTKILSDKCLNTKITLPKKNQWIYF